jgi:diketogulonate reductase-like aldo/keto reductase
MRYNGKRGNSREGDVVVKIVKLSELETYEIPRTLTPEEIAEAYALSRATFTAADLQRYTELDEGVPAEDLFAELEETQRRIDPRTP